MCIQCEYREPSLSRRNFLNLSALGLGAVTAGLASNVFAAGGPPPKPENVLSPAAALERLVQGNKRYVKSTVTRNGFGTSQAALAQGQNPYACILGCADSRVSPELLFDEHQGDLFVTRVAGNFVTHEILASLEYGTTVLNASIVMVLGHTSCGAVSAAIKAVENEEDLPGHIQTLASALSSAVTTAKNNNPKDLADYVTRQNVRNNVQLLRQATPLLSKRVRDRQLRVVGGLYDINTGRVELIET
jgi:carbonic anhydrase